MAAAVNHRQRSKSEELPLHDVYFTHSARKKLTSIVVSVLLGLFVIGEIAFMLKLDMAKNAELVNSWAESFYTFTRYGSSPLSTAGFESKDEQKCKAWLEVKDSVDYSRDFDKDPVYVVGDPENWKTCSVGCKFGHEAGKKPDAAFGFPQPSGTSSVLRSMESATYYGENNINNARRRGYNVVMTTSLSSDVPVGYFSWSEYSLMDPVQPKTETALAAAFISNCGARNFRLQALVALEKANVTIDSYGSCHRNRDGRVEKLEALRRYKFSLAFENSNEEDYVTEKFWQSLVAGTVPVVIGAPNIEDFAPSPESILHIKEVKDVDAVAKKMKYLSENPTAYNDSLRWKFEGPSDSFKALIDMAAVHSSCRLCIFLATEMQHKDEEDDPRFKSRPCKCATASNDAIHHIYVRERGRFRMESVFLRSDKLTLEGLSSAIVSKFSSLNHVPVWKSARPESIRGGDELKVYRVYPIGLTQREALYKFRFGGDHELKDYVEKHPCAKFEVIFV